MRNVSVVLREYLERLLYFKKKARYLSDHFYLDDGIDKNKCFIQTLTFNNNSRYLCVVLVKLASSVTPSVWHAFLMAESITSLSFCCVFSTDDLKNYLCHGEYYDYQNNVNY